MGNDERLELAAREAYKLALENPNSVHAGVLAGLKIAAEICYSKPSLVYRTIEGLQKDFNSKTKIVL